MLLFAVLYIVAMPPKYKKNTEVQEQEVNMTQEYREDSEASEATISHGSAALDTSDQLERILATILKTYKLS